MPSKSKSLSVAFLFDDTLDSSDGVAQYVKTLGAWLSQNGHRVTYLVGESQTQQWAGGRVYSLSRNLKIIWGGNRLSVSVWPRLKLTRRVLRDNNFDVVHVMVPYSPFMAQPLINRLAKRTALIGTVHVFPANFVGAWGSKLLRLVYGKSLKRFDLMLSVSAAAQAYAMANLKVGSTILPNVVELRKFKTDLPSRGAPTIVFLGRLVPRKGCLELVKAFGLLKSRLPEARLIIGGKGPQQAELKKYIARNKIKDVHFAGFVAEEDKPAFLAQAHVACFPSLYGESFGIVLIEAMAAGARTVLGGNNPGYSTVLGDQPELLIDPRRTKDFANRLETLIKDSKKADLLHAWQVREVRKYDVETVGKKLLSAYGEAIAINKQNEHN